MNGLDLFTGGGLFSLALRNRIPDFRTVAYVENEAYCQALLVARITDGLLDDAPIWDDVKTFDGRPFAGVVDIITGGFPCQPYSVAGKQAGEDDERNLWPDTIRIIGEVRPRFVLLENVPGLLGFGYIRRIFGDLATSGYDAEWDVVGASDVGASHRRKRLWILAHSQVNRRTVSRLPGQVIPEGSFGRESDGIYQTADVGDPTTGQDDGRRPGIMAGPERQGRRIDPAVDHAGQVMVNPPDNGLQCTGINSDSKCTKQFGGISTSGTRADLPVFPPLPSDLKPVEMESFRWWLDGFLKSTGEFNGRLR